MLDATFDDPDVTTFTGLEALGLQVLGQRLEPDRTVLACVVDKDPNAAEADRWRRRCGCPSAPRGTVIRRLAQVPFGTRPTTLILTLVHYVCTGCGRTWRQNTTAAAEPRAKLTRAALTWARWRTRASTEVGARQSDAKSSPTRDCALGRGHPETTSYE